MTAYTVNNYDVCAAGYERLRSNSEFILHAYVDANSGIEDIRSQLLSDIQCCDRFDGFDYDAARQCVNTLCDELAPSFATANPFSLEPVASDVDDDSGVCGFYVYVQAPIEC
jgi:hypothetical protein